MSQYDRGNSNQGGRYRKRASFYFKNFDKEIREGNKEKAGEALWGTVSCLVNALSILERGRPLSDHKEQSIFAQQLLISKFKEGEELAKIYRTAEKFHVNFYHAFLDEDEFKNMVGEIQKLIHFLERALKEKLNKIKP